MRIARALVPAALVAIAALATAPAQRIAPPTGHRLVYDLPAYDVSRLLDGKPGATLAQLKEQLLTHLRQSLGADFPVTDLGGTTFAVDVLDAAAAARIRPRIEHRALEMRVVADSSYADDGVRFDLAAEKTRLEDWLAHGGRDLVVADPQQIELFNGDAKNGPLAAGHLRWVPHRIKPSADDQRRWDVAYIHGESYDGVPALRLATVAAFDVKTEWNDGVIQDPVKAPPFLLEYLAVNWHEVSFCGADLVATDTAITNGPDGRAAIAYRLRDERAGSYADWSQKYIRKHSAILVDGEVVSAPYFMSRIPGNGTIAGSFGSAEAEALAARLRAGDLPIAAKLLRLEPLPPK